MYSANQIVLMKTPVIGLWSILQQETRKRTMDFDRHGFVPSIWILAYT
jgi:hypothetical protein